jgi:hypothetical protein
MLIRGAAISAPFFIDSTLNLERLSGSIITYQNKNNKT